MTIHISWEIINHYRFIIIGVCFVLYMFSHELKDYGENHQNNCLAGVGAVMAFIFLFVMFLLGILDYQFSK